MLSDQSLMQQHAASLISSDRSNGARGPVSYTGGAKVIGGGSSSKNDAAEAKPTGGTAPVRALTCLALAL